MQTALTIPTIHHHGGRAKWVGRVLTAIPVLFLLFDVAGKLANIAPVREGSLRLGFPLSESWWMTTSYTLVRDEMYDVGELASLAVREAAKRARERAAS